MRGENEMNKEKTKTVLLQCAICSLFPLLGIFLPYLKLKVDMGDWGTESKSVTGKQLISALGEISDLGSYLDSYIEEAGTATTIVFMLITLFVLLPVILFVASAVWHGMAFYKEERINKKMAILPLGAAVLSLAGLLLTNWWLWIEVQDISGNTFLVGSASALKTIVDMDDSLKLTLSAQGGFWITVLTGIIIGIEDYIFGTADEPEKRPQFVQDAIYRTQNHMQQGNQQVSSYGTKKQSDTIWNGSEPFKKPVYTRGEWYKQNNNAEKSRQMQTSQWLTGDPTQKSQALSGMLICVRGEYRGAQIQLHNGESLYLGRSKECNLVLSNAKASRKHCKVIYDAKEDRYLLKNYSDNGVFLPTGQRLGKGKAWKVPHGTVFLLTKEDEFRLL